MTIITRVTSVNREKIISDARAGFPDDTAFVLTHTGTLIVSGLTPFAGEYRIVKVKGPRWLGDNGYTFERDLNIGDTLVMNTWYDTGDKAFRNARDARVSHFIRLIEKYHLDDKLLALTRGSIDAATSADEIRTLQPLIEYLTSGYAIAAFTEAYEAALARLEVKPPAAPTAHPQRQRVIDRALETNRRYEDSQVAQYPLLREVALDFIRSYRGENPFVQDIAIKLNDYGTLSIAQLRGALNMMVAEARIERAEVAMPVDAPPYMDLRRKADREVEAAGDAISPTSAAERATGKTRAQALTEMDELFSD